MSCCNDRSNSLRQSLVENDSLIGASINSNSYGSAESKTGSLPEFQTASLLTPQGLLGAEFGDALDEIFQQYSGGRLFILKEGLIQYFKRCYPDLSAEKYYEDRAQYWLTRYGQTVQEIQKIAKELLDSLIESKESTIPLTDTYAPHSARRKRGIEAGGKAADITASNASIVTKSKQHSISIPVTRSQLEATMSEEENANDLCLFKTKFLLLYRKAAVDKPMMCRLEMVSMGKFIFRSGHLIDRTKQLDKLAFTVQQLRNRYGTHLEERKRIENAESPKQRSADIESWIKQEEEPLDAANDQTNLFRKRRPIKFPRICHSCCCCCVCVIRACE